MLSKTTFVEIVSEGTVDITRREHWFQRDGVLDVEPYAMRVPPQDLNAYRLTIPVSASIVRRSAKSEIDLVHLATSDKNAFLVILVDNAHETILGHFLLDLNAEYGIGESQ